MDSKDSVSPKECETRHNEVWGAIRGKVGQGLFLWLFGILVGVFTLNTVWALGVKADLSVYKEVEAVKAEHVRMVLDDIRVKVNELYVIAVKEGKVSGKEPGK